MFRSNLFRSLSAVGAFSLVTHATAQEASPALKERGETPAQRDARMEWFRDARFGLFIHWGLYAQAGGMWNGKPAKVNQCAEWLMMAAKPKVADYAALAKDFNPVKYDADAWVRAARDAGMKYLVITTKHHEGFAMFQSAASPFNIVDATPYHRDIIKPLAEACHRYGIKLGFYYSQNLDWHHPGGGGGGWDPAQKGDAGAYVDQVVIPQLTELLSNYGKVDVLWFDIPGGVITSERANRIWQLITTKQPGIIVNNRLGGGYHGDIETPEQHIPPNGFPGKDWESCMTMNHTWGFAKDDHDWKPTRVLIHNLADIASKGGNYLLNVGPNELGEIPQPSLERLSEIGAWMKVNGPAIYQTRTAGFPTLPAWGRITMHPERDGNTTLYAIVFDAPSSGEISLPGVTNSVISSSVLGTEDHPEYQNKPQGVTVTIPKSLMNQKDFVIALKLQGKLQLDPSAQADDAGIIRLTPRQAVTTLGLREEITGSSGIGQGPEPHLGFWTDPAATATWKIKSTRQVTCHATARVAIHPGSAGGVVEFVLGDTVLPVTFSSTGGWDQYITVNLGTLTVPAGNSQLIARVKTKPGEAPCNLGEITLTPAP